MKVIKLSMVTIGLIGVCTSSMAGDSFLDSLKEGKIKGEAKAYYFNRDTKSKTNERSGIFTTGVSLEYKTKSYNGFDLGVLMQSSSSPFASEDAKSEYNADMYGSGAQLSNAYLEYNVFDTNIKIGRQFIDTPLIRGSSSRVIEQAFEGETIVSKLIPKTEISLININKYQNRTDQEGNVGKFEDVGEHSVPSILIATDVIPNTVVRAQYLDVKDDYKTRYFDIEYKNEINDIGYNLAYQYVSSKTEKGDKSNVYAMRVGIDKGNFSSYIAYSKTNEGNKPKLGLGSGVYGVYYTKSTVAAAAGVVNTKGAEAYALNLQYKISGVKVGARYVTLKEPNGNKTKIPGAFVSYNFTKALNLNLAYEQHKYDFSDDNDSEMRLKLRYKF